MEIEEVYKRLCSYDKRNPDNVIDEEFGITESKKDDCNCDNCFYGRNKLALTILELLNALGLVGLVVSKY